WRRGSRAGGGRGGSRCRGSRAGGGGRSRAGGGGRSRAGSGGRSRGGGGRSRGGGGRSTRRGGKCGGGSASGAGGSASGGGRGRFFRVIRGLLGGARGVALRLLLQAVEALLFLLHGFLRFGDERVRRIAGRQDVP